MGRWTDEERVLQATLEREQNGVEALAPTLEMDPRVARIDRPRPGPVGTRGRLQLVGANDHGDVRPA